MSELLTELRGFGLAMGTRYAPTSFTDSETKEDHFSQLHVGYTTDRAKADKARDAGATVTTCPPVLGAPAWEIMVRVIDPSRSEGADE